MPIYSRHHSDEPRDRIGRYTCVGDSKGGWKTNRPGSGAWGDRGRPGYARARRARPPGPRRDPRYPLSRP